MDELREKYKWLVRIIAILFVGYLTFNAFIAKAQSDSMYCAPIQKIRIIVAKAQLLSYANQAIDSLEATVKTGAKLQLDTDSLLNLRTEQLTLARLDTRDSVALVKVYLKQEKRKKRNAQIVAGAIIAFKVVRIALKVVFKIPIP